ncbi:hypothetical protein LOTGIDRAFT_159871 [Lottia gigantea]|uniref:FH2 domain-containing protein n=1 Tax=Lottia gigantea TaxID=225164 RepID=V4ANV3_LOTGI|nr:hypothetical protein LOTGIDRAFT_159871 [Lottia gigantea]ESO96460.1 hypothetical protein LOTGIDRAFT_159871 [Lottia gigantea]
MPAKNGFCWCLGGTRPPEIKHSMDTEGTLKPMEVDIPMPTDEEELNAKFQELVAELDLDKPHQEALYSLPNEKKWQIYCSKKKDVDPTTQSLPDKYIEKISAMSPIQSGLERDEDLLMRTKVVDNLKTALRTQTMSFVVRFVDNGGLQCLLEYLCKMDYWISESSIHTSIIGCIKGLMNNSHGRSHVLAHPRCINIIAQSLRVENVKTKIAVLEILGAVCIVPGGHKKVLQAMIHFQHYAAERTRFQTLINDLDRSTGKYREEVNLKTAIMSFFNAALKYGPGQDHLEFRLHLRYEFLMLGIQPIIEKLRSHENSTLDRHLDFFEMVRNEDEKEIAKKFESVHIDTKSASAMFELLRKKLALSTSYNNFMSILQHLVMLPYSKKDMTPVWILIDKMVQQVVLQRNGQDPDVAPMEEINIQQITHRLASENDVKSFQNKLREAEKANDELNAKLAKRERECEARFEEKEELMSTMNHMNAKLEKEMAAHADVKLQLNSLMAQLHEVTSYLEAERGEKQKLQHLVKTGSLPDDAKMGLSTSQLLSGTMLNKDFKIPSVLAPSAPPPSAPPPPPPAPGAPPPPPFGGPALGGKQKKIPKPGNPMKSFNWTKLPENQIKGTVWSDLDDTKLYNTLDLGDFEKNFSAYQRQEEGEQDTKTHAPKVRELSVIDGRRAQNCTILLSKLKLTNEEIKKAVLNVDEAEDIPKDMVEQLLKFVPTVEEIQLLNEHSHERENMARADRFLLDMSKILHYEQRLNAIYFKKKFQDRRLDCKGKISAVFDASKQLFRCRRLKKLLEIVLAIGNYMNRGQRGNASGFRIQSLNKMVDTKSSINKNVTLLHYLIEAILEKKFPDLMKLEQDICAIKDAAKVTFKELDEEMKALKSGLKDIEKEVEFFRSQYDGHPDKFVTTMSNFCTVAAYNFSELEDSYGEMKQKYDMVVKAFGEDPTAMQPEEFCGIFDSFLNYFNDAQIENEKFRQQKQEEDKRSKMEEQLKKDREKRILLRRASTNTDKTSVNGNNSKLSQNDNEKGEFDDLISALRTGDVFGEDMAKMKRTRRRVSNSNAEMSRERMGKIMMS